MDDKVKFAVIGYGHIGRRHAEMISRNAESRLVAVADINGGLKSEAEATYNVPFYASFEELLKAEINIDVVCIATPNGLHVAQGIAAIKAGCHIVVEKPMALTTADGNTLLKASERYGKHVFCVMQNRYSPPSVWLKQAVSAGVLGDIYMVQINCYWNRDCRYYKPGNWHGTAALDGGTLFTQFSHFIDLMYWVFGDVDDISAGFANHSHEGVIDFEDSGMVNFRFLSGGMGCINYSTSVWDKNLESSMTIIGQNGSIKIGGQYMDKVQYCHVKDYVMPELTATNAPNDYGMYKGSAANHHFVIENVVDVLKGRGVITTGAEEGLKVVNIIERIYSHKKR